jgi:hypothetical protein
MTSSEKAFPKKFFRTGIYKEEKEEEGHTTLSLTAYYQSCDNGGTAQLAEQSDWDEKALADATQERIRCLYEGRSARLRLMATTGVMGSAAMQLAQ